MCMPTYFDASMVHVKPYLEVLVDFSLVAGSKRSLQHTPASRKKIAGLVSPQHTPKLGPRSILIACQVSCCAEFLQGVLEGARE